MGGGDLNLKKSWHPQTLRNVEKVWKAEQKAEAEAKKIDQLRRELDEEREREEMQKYAIDQGIVKKKSDRLEWMYSAPGHAGVNREDYLLGKSIDKAVDPLAVNEDKNAEAPGASFMDDAGQNAGTDLATKIRDDPLFMIKKKENEKKKELLKNPVRMKQLQQMLKADLGKKAGKKGKREKKKRKKEKRKKHSSDEHKSKKDGKKSSYDERRKARDSESSEDSDEQVNGSLDHRDRKNHHDYKTVEHGDKHESRHKNLEHKRYSKKRSSSISPENRTNRTKITPHNSTSSGHKVNRHSRSRSTSSSPSPKKQRRDNNSTENHSKDNRRHRSEDYRDSRSSSGRRHRSRSQSPPTSRRTGTRENSRSDSQSFASSKRKQTESGATRKMTDEERERKLAEMMDNAKWRDEQRGKNVKRYKEEDEKEAKEIATNTEKGASFVQPMKVQTFTSSTASVENRIKRNIHSLQRTPAALENFLKKK